MDPKTLTPEGVPRITRVELTNIREAPPGRRRAMIAAMASAAALVDMTRKVHEVERVLESASTSPNADEEMKKRLQKERDTLRAELKRLGEEHDRQRLFRSTVLNVLAEAERDRRNRIHQAATTHARRQSLRRTRSTTGRWGRDCPGCEVRK